MTKCQTTRLKYILPTSYELIIMAHAGATLATLGTIPLVNPFTPSVLHISFSWFSKE